VAYIITIIFIICAAVDIALSGILIHCYKSYTERLEEQNQQLVQLWEKINKKY